MRLAHNPRINAVVYKMYDQARTVPNHAGSWGAVGGIVAILGGLAFIGATLWESRMMMEVRAPTEA